MAGTLRYSWTSYFRDEGDYCNENSPSDRWEQIKQDQNLTVKDWRSQRRVCSCYFTTSWR